MMKNLRYMTAILAAVCFTACQTDDLPDIPVNNGDLPEGFYVGDDIPITLGFSYSAEATGDATTRVQVRATEDEVADISLLCFDGEGFFLGKRDLHEENKVDASAIPQDDDAIWYTQEPYTHPGTQPGDVTLFRGKIHIEVPENTARIHIVTNRNLVMTGEIIGRHVNDVMSSEELSSSMDNTRVVFWGYHREYSSDAFQEWLKKTDGSNTLYLIRGRARVEIGKVLDEKVKSISWVISSGLSRGYIAPMNRNALNADPFEGYYTGAGEQAVETTTQLTPYQSDRYVAAKEDLEPVVWYTADEEGTDESGVEKKKGNVIKAQSAKKYLFEDANNDATNPVRIILKVEYDPDKLDDHQPRTRYHVLKFLDNEGNSRAIYRNRTYVLNLIRLNEDLGEETFEKALTTDKFSNDMLNYVQQAVKNVNLGGRMLQITSGTAMLIQEGTTGTINFRYTQVDQNANQDLNYTFSYNETTGNGSVTFNVNAPSTTLRTGVIRLSIDNWATIIEGTDPINRLLSRNINVYTYQGFSFTEATKPTLVDAGENRTWTIDYGDDHTQAQNRRVYKLTFTLPSNYPDDLLPLRFKFATSTLNAFADKDVRDGGVLQPHGTFNTVTEDTDLSDLEGIGDTSDENNWYYDIEKWGYWYNYEIDHLPADKQFTFYLCDVRGKRGTSETQSIGLVYKIEYGDSPVQLPFGGPVAVNVSN